MILIHSYENGLMNKGQKKILKNYKKDATLTVL